MDIADWRHKIDAVDQQLVELLNQRCEFALAIGALKRERGMAITEPGRESEVLANIAAANRGPLTGAVLEEMFRCIMAQMRHMQAVQDEY